MIVLRAKSTTIISNDFLTLNISHFLENPKIPRQGAITLHHGTRLCGQKPRDLVAQVRTERDLSDLARLAARMEPITLLAKICSDCVD